MVSAQPNQRQRKHIRVWYSAKHWVIGVSWTFYQKIVIVPVFIKTESLPPLITSQSVCDNYLILNIIRGKNRNHEAFLYLNTQGASANISFLILAKSPQDALQTYQSQSKDKTIAIFLPLLPNTEDGRADRVINMECSGHFVPCVIQRLVPWISPSSSRI